MKEDFIMKTKIKLCGNHNRGRRLKVPLLIIAIVAVIGFSLTGCGDPDYVSTIAKVKIVNNSGNTIYVAIWRVNGSDVAWHNCGPINSGSDDTVSPLTEGTDYFLGKYTPITTGETYMLKTNLITQQSRTFTAEAGKTIIFAYNSYGFSRN